MGPVLGSLVKLQSVENRLRAVKTKLLRCRRGVIFQENQLRVFQNELEAKLEEIRLTRIQADRLELELKSRDEHIAKFRAALNVAKSNKEYSAILTELNTSKADNSKLESQVLDLMKNIETDESACIETQQQIDQQKEKLNQVRKDTEIKAAEYEKQIDEIQSEWNESSASIPPDVLEMFKRVADTYDGEALAAAEEQGRLKNQSFSCGGCFMGLTAETVNQLMTKDDIIRCSNCSRILVLKDSEI